MVKEEIPCSLIRTRYLVFVLFILSVAIVLAPFSHSWGDPVRGKVISIQSDSIELSVGSEKGLRSGDSGRVYYTIVIEGKERPIFVAKFKISYLSENTSMARIEEKTADIRVGYLAEVVVRLGEIEVRSEPSGAKVYLDGKEVGETPVVLPGIKPGPHSIRIVKDGYEPYEVGETVETGRKRIVASLKRVVKEGELIVRSEPSGGTVVIDGTSVGTSPYVGKGLTAKVYRLRVLKEGYEFWEREQAVEVGKTIEVSARLQLKEKTGEIEIRSEPIASKIYLDGKAVGNSPLLLSKVQVGKHTIQVVKEGYTPYEEQINVTEAERKRVSPSLKRMGGELTVRTDPLGTHVQINGKPAGVSPY